VIQRSLYLDFPCFKLFTATFVLANVECSQCYIHSPPKLILFLYLWKYIHLESVITTTFLFTRCVKMVKMFLQLRFKFTCEPVSDTSFTVWIRHQATKLKKTWQYSLTNGGVTRTNISFKFATSSICPPLSSTHLTI
jgi:hypothetical protein